MVLIFSFALAGCHTIHPVAQPDSALLKSISPKSAKIGLVLDSVYRDYKSKDRGDMFADPQTYLIGQALVPLTTAYFEKAFQSVSVYETLPNKLELHGEGYVIRPRIREFDNELIGFSEQEISVTLAAEIYDQNMNLMKEVKAHAYEEGKLGFFNSSKDSGLIVSRGLQKALLAVIKEIEKVLTP